MGTRTRRFNRSSAQFYEVDEAAQLSHAGQVSYLAQKATTFLEDPKGHESLDNWRREVRVPTICAGLKSPKFVRDLVYEVTRERGSLSILMEIAKGLLCIDTQSFRAVGATPTLETFFPAVLLCDPPSALVDSHSSDPKLIVSELGRFVMRILIPPSADDTDAQLPHYILDNTQLALHLVWKYHPSRPPRPRPRPRPAPTPRASPSSLHTKVGCGADAVPPAGTCVTIHSPSRRCRRCWARSVTRSVRGPRRPRSAWGTSSRSSSRCSTRCSW